MKKNLKRWLALLLAIAMIVTSGAFTNLTYLRATDSETPEAAASAETQQETKTEEKEKEKKQEVKVEAKDDKSAEEAKKVEEEAKAKAEAEAKAAEQKKAEEAAKAEEQKKTEEAAKADEQKAEESATTEEAQKSNEETKAEENVTPAESGQQDQKAEESAKEENKEQTYDITIKEPGKDGGSIRAWIGDAGKVDVSFKDGKYVKEVKEGQTFHFEIKTKDGYSVDKVKAGKEQIKAKNVDGNTYTYELKNVKENKTLNIKYKEEKATDTQTVDTEETSTVESQTSETGATEEETSSDDGDVPQQEEQTTDATTPEQSVVDDQNAADGSVVDETQNDTVSFAMGGNSAVYANDPVTVEAGTTTSITSKKNWYYDNSYWKSADTSIAMVEKTDYGRTANITGVSEGTVTIYHANNSEYSNWGYSNWNTKNECETFTVTVINGKPSITINGADSVNVGSTINLTATVKNTEGNVEWSSADQTIATVSATGVVTGVKVGKVNIYATIGEDLIATKVINVTRDESNGHYVYLYTKVTGDTSGLTLNKDGWYTIGRVWVSGISSPENRNDQGYRQSGNDWDALTRAMQSASNIDRYTGANTSIVLSSISWTGNGKYGLKIANGATNYVNNGTDTWHLDGEVNVSTFGSVTINYYEAGTTNKIAESVTLNADDGTIVNSQDYKIDIPGYTYSYADKDSYTVVKRQNGTINLYYTKGSFSYTVKYLERDTEKEVANSKHGSSKFGATIIEDAIDVIGYTKVDPTTATIKIKANADQNVITFYYVKDETQTHSVQAQVEYYYGDDPETAKAKTMPDATDKTAVAEGWIGEATTVTVTPNESDKFAGYKYWTTEGAISYTVEANASSDPELHKVKVYYVKDTTQTHSIKAQVEYYYGNNLTEAKAKTTPDDTDEIVVAEGWLGDAVTAVVNPNTTNKFTGYKYDSKDGELEYRLEAKAPTDAELHIVKVYYVKDDGSKHSVQAQVKYYCGDTLKEAKAKETPDAVDDIRKAEGWIGEVTTVTVSPNENGRFPGYRWKLTEGELSYSVAAGAESDETLHEVKVYYVKDESQTHSIRAQVEYYYGDTLDIAKAKTTADEKDTVVTNRGWIGETTTVLVTPNTSNKFAGYTYAETEGDLSYSVAAGAEDDTTLHIVKVYYVKDESQKHSVQAQVKYYYGDTLAEAKAKEEADAIEDIETAEGWIGETTTVTVYPNTTDRFIGYMYAETANATSYSVAAKAESDPTVHEVRVYYVKNENQKHSVQAQVEYYYGDTLEQAKAKETPDDTEAIQIANGWIGEVTTVTVNPNETNKYVGYRYAETVGAKSYSVAAREASDTDTHKVKVYYVKDGNQKHSIRAQVEYYYGDTLAEAKAKTMADATDTVKTAEGWIGEITTVTVTPNTTDKFVGYTHVETAGDLDYSVAAKAPTDETLHVVKVYYVKDASQKHSVQAQVEYYYGDTLEDAQAKRTADVTDTVVRAEGWIGEGTTVTVAPNTADKFVGYKYDSTVGALSYSIAAKAPTDETLHIVKVYYVKDASQIHSVRAKVEYYYGDTLADAKAKTVADATDAEVTQTGWIGEVTTVSVAPNTTDKFTGYKWDSTEGALDYSVAAGTTSDQTLHIVKVYYVKDDGSKHSVQAQVKYYYGNTLEEAQAKTTADEVENIEKAEGWIGEETTVTVSPNENDKFIGYRHELTEGDLSYSVAAGAESDQTLHEVKVYYVKDESQQHSIRAQVEYYYGDTLADAKAKTAADATDAEVTQTGWIGETTTVSVTPNTTNKFTGYAYAETEGDLSYSVAAKAPTDETLHIVKVYYVKDESQTHSVQAQVEYYYGDTLAEARAKETADAVDDIREAEGWIGTAAIVTVEPNEQDKFIGYTHAETIGATSYRVAANEESDPQLHKVKVYYVKDENQQHSIQAQVEYYYGDTLDEAQAKTTADAKDTIVRAIGWIGEETTVTVVPNTADKFVGYKYDSIVGALSYSVAAKASSDETLHIVKVYYVKDESQTHSVRAQVEYYYGDTLESAKAKTTADAKDTVVSVTGWIGEVTSVAVSPNTTNKFVGYKHAETEGDLSYSVAAGAESDQTLHEVKVYYVKDESQQHSIRAQVEYYYGDTLADAKAKTAADATDAEVTQTGWIGETTTVSVTPNTTNKFTGYAYAETEGDLSYSVAAKAPTDETLHIVKVYYVKDESQTHSVQAQVEYYYGDTLAEAKAKETADTVDAVETESGWIGEATTVTVTPNTADKFTGYKYAETNGELSYTVAANAVSDEKLHIVKVYYVKDTEQKHSIQAQVEYYYGNTLEDARAKTTADAVDTVETATGWIGETTTVTVTPNTTDKFAGYRYETMDGELSYTIAANQATLNEIYVVKVYYVIELHVTGEIDHGIVSNSNQTVEWNGKSAAMDFTVAEGYIISEITINGEKQTVGSEQKSYTYPAMEGIKQDIHVAVKTVPLNPGITVHKNVTSTPANGSSYALGETITYEIVAENTGNQTLTNVVVTDPLTNGRWTIESMTPGQKSTVMTTSYVVTEADIQKGSVLNVATATSDENPKPTPGEKEVPTEQQKPSLFITKEADKTSNIQVGDVITYTITVTNNGNVTINDIEVKDQLTGDTFNKNVFNLIGSISLAPGESRQFAVRYTATQNDIVNGSIRNVATVTGTDPDGNPVNGEAEKTVDTEKANADYTVTKTVDNPQAEYKVGDVINYTIRVTNTGNLTLNNLTVTDQMQGASGNAVIANKAGVAVNSNTATIATLAVGASIELKVSYTVVRADADGTLANRVNVTSTTKPGEDPENPNGPTTPSRSDETDPTPTEKTYVLTIHYVDNNGNVVARDYTARLLAGETIDAVVSPTIAGYTPNYGTVALPATGMPAANVTVTVVYTPNAPVVVPDNPQNPNQPNNGGNNGGGNVVNNNNNNANNANNANNGNNAANNNAGQAAANPAPADGVIQPDDNGGYDLTPVEDTPTPLANMNLDDHACCILHFLIMLLTLIIFALYTKSRKNRQLKVEELREQLAIASIQKELDLSDEDMAKYLEEAKKLAEEKKQANA